MRELAILGPGSFFGEDSTFLGRNDLYNVEVSSSQAEIMYIRKSELTLIPHNMKSWILKQIKIRQESWKFKVKKM